MPIMPFPLKIQPIDEPQQLARSELAKPIGKSRLKRLFELQFLKNSTAEKVMEVQPSYFTKESSVNVSAEYEPSSVCLAKMVQSFIEESNNEKQPSTAIRCGRHRSNCFNGNCDDSSEDEFDYVGYANRTSSVEACEILKSLVPCACVGERNLLADTARIVEKNRICKRKDDICRKLVIDGLLALGYDASICKSRWEKSPSYPAGEYEYIDVIVSNERLLIDIDFRSEFEIARSTKAYKSVLQSLPSIFVGKPDRLQKIIAVVSDAARQSLKKKGMHIPPWRKADYIKAKWLSPHTRSATPSSSPNDTRPKHEGKQTLERNERRDVDKAEQEENGAKELGEPVFPFSYDGSADVEEQEKATEVEEWKPPVVKPRNARFGACRMVAGLASVFEDEPTKF